jgi:hypothetical protein
VGVCAHDSCSAASALALHSRFSEFASAFRTRKRCRFPSTAASACSRAASRIFGISALRSSRARFVAPLLCALADVAAACHLLLSLFEAVSLACSAAIAASCSACMSSCSSKSSAFVCFGSYVDSTSLAKMYDRRSRPWERKSAATSGMADTCLADALPDLSRTGPLSRRALPLALIWMRYQSMAAGVALAQWGAATLDGLPTAEYLGRGLDDAALAHAHRHRLVVRAEDLAAVGPEARSAFRCNSTSGWPGLTRQALPQLSTVRQRQQTNGEQSSGEPT